MPLPSPIDLDDWSSEIADEAVGEMNAVIAVYLPGADGLYDPVSDSDPNGTNETLVMGPARRARIQHIRRSIDTNTGGGWTGITSVRFQVELLADDPVIQKGMIVRVIDGAKDASLVGFAYTVERAVNSSHAALRTIEALSELALTPAVVI